MSENKKAGGDSSAPSVQDAKRVLAEEKLKAYVAEVVAKAPKISAAARDEIATLLRGGV